MTFKYKDLQQYILNENYIKQILPNIPQISRSII